MDKQNDYIPDLRTLVIAMRSDINDLKDEFPRLREDITELKTSLKYTQKVEDQVDKNLDKILLHDKWIFGAYLTATVISILIPIILTSFEVLS